MNALTILSEDVFIKEFTKKFLNTFYGSLLGFDVDTIVERSKTNIINRMQELKPYTITNPELVDYIVNNGTYIEYMMGDWDIVTKFSDSKQWDIIIHEMEYVISNLFSDAIKTIYVCEFNDTNEIDINNDLNLILLQWVRQKDFDFYFY